MSKLTESFRQVGVVNSYDFYGHGQPFIAYRGESLSPGGRGFQVHRPGYQTDPKGAWYDHGDKTFLLGMERVTKESKAATRAEAEAWASERYGIKEWKRDPFGSWGDAEFIDRRIRELKAQVASGGDGQ